ncbi:MAG TPA: hypothetical protein VHP55_03380, partial [Usitatibacter sp.]|nr:hypothetical protein [Usitatibacter sp.]
FQEREFHVGASLGKMGQGSQPRMANCGRTPGEARANPCRDETSGAKPGIAMSCDRLEEVLAG